MTKKIEKPLIKSNNKFPVVGVGASAGGLNAFTELLKAIPEKSGMAYVLVQHLHPVHESVLPELLQKATKIPVLEITDDITVEPDHIYIIPSNKMLLSNDGKLELSQRPEPKKDMLNLPINLFFTSLAEVHQAHSIGVVLSGTGSDGTLGLKAISGHGGITFAQDKKSAQYDGMPQSAVDAGVVDFILPPNEIPQKLLEVTKIMNGEQAEGEDASDKDPEIYKQILSVLRVRKNTDFTYYKQTTIRRRILRRMALNKKDDPTSYLDFLRKNKDEQDSLYQDLLIPVTNFFRDPKIFDHLCQTVFPKIVEQKKKNESIRIWSAGCSTGQEAYSIAMCFKEYMGNYSLATSGDEKIQIFASDISGPAIARARKAEYSKTEVEGVDEERLQKFFVKSNGKYLVKKEIREMCVFAVHNFLKDPPFGNLDFISCRNVLIYMEPYLQKKALTTFHYALNAHSGETSSGANKFLLLGKSETCSGVPALFWVAHKKDKLFKCKNVPEKFLKMPGRPSEEERLSERQGRPAFEKMNRIPTNENGRIDFEKTTNDLILQTYTSPGVVVNENMDIVYFRGNTAKYLEQQAGKPSHNLLKMAKNGLGFELQSLVRKAKKEMKAVGKGNIPLETAANHEHIAVEAIPLSHLEEPHYLILFHPLTPMQEKVEARWGTMRPPAKNNVETGFWNGLAAGFKNRINPREKSKSDRDNPRIKHLQNELIQTKMDMRSMMEEQMAANEELQSANEELLAGNEELQSLNEEVETSQEELQSANEELTVVNQQLINLNDELTSSKEYAVAIVETIREPLLVLGKDLRVISSNKYFHKTFQVTEQEVEGKLIYKIANGAWDTPQLRRLLDNIIPEKESFDDFEMDHDFPSLGHKIMLLYGKQLKGYTEQEKLILLVIEDITERKETVQKIEDSERRYHEMIYSSPFLIATFTGKDMIIEIANDAILESWGKGRQVIGKSLFSVMPEIIGQGFDKTLNDVYESGKPFRAYEMPVELFRNGKMQLIYYNFTYYPQRDIDGKIFGIVVMANEVTPQAEFNRMIKEHESNFRQITDLMRGKILNTDEKGNAYYFNQYWLDDTGKSREELAGRGWQKMIHPDDFKSFIKAWKKSLKSGKEFEMEFGCLDKNGEYKWHLGRATPVKNEAGEIKSWINTAIEIQKLKEEEKRKEDFLKMVSHELKTPVTSIKGYVEFLYSFFEDDEAVQMADIPLKSALERMGVQINRLTRLISEILDISRVENNQLHFEKGTFSINELVKETVRDINYADTGHTIEIQEECECDIHADKDRIGQVIINLVTNAIKYSPNHQPLEIKIQNGKNNQVKVSVKDHGIGIDKIDQKKIFERFYRVGGVDQKTYSGFGIGLFLSNEIIQRHNGTITVKSKKGEGSVFSFSLPINEQ